MLFYACMLAIARSTVFETIMNRRERIVDILDESVGDTSTPLGFPLRSVVGNSHLAQDGPDFYYP